MRQMTVAAPGFTVRLRLMEFELRGKLEFHKLMFKKNGRSLIISQTVPNISVKDNI